MPLLEDIRYALRQFKNTPGFTTIAIGTLALGIGATTAIFTLVDAVMLKSLPVAKPDELWRVGNEEVCCVDRGLQHNWSLFSFEQYRLFQENTPEFTDLAAFQAGSSLLGVRRAGGQRASETFRSEYVSGNYFRTFGITAYLGRTFTPRDSNEDAPAVAVMSFRMWQEKFGKDPSVVGAGFVVNSHPVTVVGIAPPGFFGDRIRSKPPALWLPLSAEPLLEPTVSLLNEPSFLWLYVIGRVTPGGSTKAIKARMQVELRQFLLSPQSKVEEREKPLIARQTLHLSPGGGGVQTMQSQYRDRLRLLMLASALVLLIACANLANLMLVRAAARKQQISIRAALGASQGALLRQAFVESIVLALLGGLAGVAIAFAGTRVILYFTFGTDDVLIQPTPSLTVLGFAFAVSLLTGLLFGIAPAWIASEADPVEALRGSNRSTGRNTVWQQKILVITQAALSLILLSAAGLLTHSLGNMHGQDFGFDTKNRYILHIDPQMAGYNPLQLNALYRQLHDRLMSIPGIQEVSFSLYSPMDGDNWTESVSIAGEPPPPPGKKDDDVSWVRVSPQFFDAIGTAIVEGRAFQERDTSSTRTVAVVNRRFEKMFFRDARAIGKRFSNDKDHPAAFEIVGVTEDTNYWGPMTKARPMYFLVQGQSAHIDDPRYRLIEDSSEYLNAIEMRARRDAAGLEEQVRGALRQINPDLAVIGFQSFASQVDAAFVQQAMIAKLTSLFGILALVLASIGLYGVTAYSVERRTSEMGIRVALGADRKTIVALVLSGAFMQVGVAVAIGLPVTILGGRVMANQLFGVTAHDPVVLGITVLVLVAAAFVAALIPARRAAKTQPIIALRSQ